jgi:hypothetical protein
MRGNLSILSVPIEKLGSITLKDISLMREFIKEHEVHSCLYSGQVQKVSSFEKMLTVLEEARNINSSEGLVPNVQNICVGSIKKPSKNFVQALSSNFYKLDQVNLLLLNSKIQETRRGILFYVLRPFLFCFWLYFLPQKK